MDGICKNHYTKEDKNKLSHIPGTFEWIKVNDKNAWAYEYIMEKTAAIKEKKAKKSHVNKIRKAGKANKVIHLVYEDKKGVVSDRYTEPYKISGDDYWGYCLTKNSIRRFKLPRIQSVNITRKKFNPRWKIEMDEE